MANGAGRLSVAWAQIEDQKIKLSLTVNELDVLYGRLRDDHTEMHAHIEAVQRDFTERINAVRTDMQKGFNDIDVRLSRLAAIGLTVVGGLLTGLILLVVQIAST